MEFTTNDQIKIEFKDGSEIIAKINVIDGDKIQASALNKNEKYNEGDTLFLDSSQDKITKLNIKTSKITKRKDGYHVISESGKNLGGPYDTKDEAVERLRQVEYFKKQSKRFQWAFDKHKPQYKYDPETNVIEKEETNVTKVGMKKQASQEQRATVYVTKILGEDWYQEDSISGKILESDLPDDQKKQKLIERATELLNNDSVYDALWRDGENNKILNRINIIHEEDDSEPVQIDESEIDTILQQYNEEKESWNEYNEEMFETKSKKASMDCGPKQALEHANIYFRDVLEGKIIPDQDDINDVAADFLSDACGINYEEAIKRIEEYQETDMLDDEAERLNDRMEEDDPDDNEPWIDPAGGTHEGRTPNLKQYEMKKQSHKLSPETKKETENTFSDVKRLMEEYDQTDDYNKLLEIKGILTSLLRVVEAEAKECMEGKSKEVRGRKISGINQKAIDEYLNNFIMDDIDWESMNTKKDLLDSAVGSILANLKEYGITSIKQLTAQQKQTIKNIVNSEWESRDNSDEYEFED